MLTNQWKGNKLKAIAAFSLYGGWLLALLFHGPVLTALLEDNLLGSSVFPLGVVISHGLGLFAAGFISKDIRRGKSVLQMAAGISLAGTLVFFTPYGILWEGAMLILGLASGIFIGTWAFYLKEFFKEKERFEAIAEVLIYANFCLMFFSVLTQSLGAAPGLLGTLILLPVSMGLLSKIDVSRDTPKKSLGQETRESSNESARKSSNVNARENSSANARESAGEKAEEHLGEKSLKPLVLLGFFIFIITINSGIMYEVVTPAFADFSRVASYYFVLPYMVAIFLIYKLPTGKPRAYSIYIGLALLGFSYILFILLEPSLGSYLWINGLMMGALGIFDLFWWSMLGKFFDDYKNPAKIFGTGLGINVMGIIIGGRIGSELLGAGQSMVVSLVALGLLFVIIILLPILNEQMLFLPGAHGFGFSPPTMEPKEMQRKSEEKEENILDNPDIPLTPREAEIAELLVRGYTYKAVAAELYLSENTVKYHVKNIYGKFEVRTKMEFIRKYR